MKEKNVMLGDWVMPKFTEGEKETKVAEIYDKGIISTSGAPYLWDEVDAILVSPKILKANGWENTETPYATLNIGEGKTLEYYFYEHRLDEYWQGIDEWENHAEVRYTLFRCTAQYVHELQHALRLCGIEKEIIL